MSFYGKNFLYNGISSEVYGLICASIDSSGSETSPAGSDVTIIEEYLNRRETPYFYGVSFPQKLEFPVGFFSEEAIPRERVSEIEKWLFGLSSYKEFKIIQEDLIDVHYNCIFTEGSLVCIGNEVFGFQATAICDAPWAWGDTKVFRKTNATGAIYLKNQSDNTRDTKPIITLTFTSNQATVSIINTSDIGSSAMVFEDVTSGEVIEVDCDLRTVSSSEEGIVERFNGKYMYLLPDMNTITITGVIGTLEIAYSPARKVGA
jgi:phage-related protein